MNLRNKRLRCAYLVYGIAMDLIFSIHTEKVQSSHVWRHDDVIIADFAQNKMPIYSEI